MKHLFIASVVMFGSAGFSAADVSVSGDGRMGILYGSDGTLGTTGNRNWAFTNRIRILFDASGETDSGLTFGGSVRADNAPAGAAGTDGEVYVESAFGRLSMGDVGGGDSAIVNDLHGVGLTGLDFMNELQFASSASNTYGYLDYLNDPAVWGVGNTLEDPPMSGRVLYEITLRGVSFAGSWSQTGSNKSYGLGLGYEFGNLSAAIGYGKRYNRANNPAFGWGVTREEDMSASLGYGMGDHEIRAIAQIKRFTESKDPVERHLSYGLSGETRFDAVTLSAYALRTTSDIIGAATVNAGIGASYDLGGGAGLQGGVARQQMFDYVAGAVTTRTRADFGVSFSF